MVHGIYWKYAEDCCDFGEDSCLWLGSVVINRDVGSVITRFGHYRVFGTWMGDSLQISKLS